jgi:hypothetical protein
LRERPDQTLKRILRQGLARSPSGRMASPDDEGNPKRPPAHPDRDRCWADAPRSPRPDGSRLRERLGAYTSPASPIGRTVDLAKNSPGDWAVSTVAEGADLDIADQRLPTRAPAPARLSLAQPKPRKLPAAKPQLNRQERVIFTAYLVMIALIVAFLAVAGLVAWLAA